MIAVGWVLVVFGLGAIVPGVLLPRAPSIVFGSSEPIDLSCRDIRASDRPLPFTCVVSQVDGTCAPSGHWLTTKAPDQITVPMPLEAADGGWKRWQPVNDGVAASPGRYDLTIQGKSDVPVVLKRVRAIVTARRAPVKGIDLWRECGGDGVFRLLNVDLDSVPPIISDTFHPDDAVDQPQYELKPIRFPYTVALLDPETFAISATTGDCDCDWRLEVDWATQGLAGTVLIGDNGRPFRTSATVNAKSCPVLNGLPTCR